MSVASYEASQEDRELATRINERQRLETEARAVARAAFLEERIAAMPKRDKPTREEAADLGRRLLEVLDKADRKIGQPGTVSFATFSTKSSAGVTVHPSWPEEVDRIAAPPKKQGGKEAAHSRMVRAEIDAVCRVVAGTITPKTMCELATMPPAALPPGAFTRIILALAWPDVFQEWKRAREMKLRRGPLAPDVMRRLGSKVPMPRDDSKVNFLEGGPLSSVSGVTFRNSEGRIDLFQPEVAAAKGAEDAFLAMTKVLGPRTTRTLWTCIDAVQRMEPDLGKATGDFFYTPGAFADVQRPRREKKVRRHDARVLAALDEDMRRLAQTRVEWTITTGGGEQEWKFNASLVLYQQATLTQGKRVKDVPFDQYGPTRQQPTKGRRPVEMWRINPTILEMMKTGGAYLTWDPSVLRCSPEAVTLYLELVAHARRNAHPETERFRVVETLVRDTGIIRPDPHNPGRMRTRLEQLLRELDAAEVLSGRLADGRVYYRLPPALEAMLDAIPRKRQSPSRALPKKG